MKRQLLAVLAVFVLCSVLNFVVHGVILQPYYNQAPQMLRGPQDAQAHMPFMILSFLIFSLAFVWIYGRGAEAKPWLGQGMRFGLAVWLIASVSRYLIYFAVQPWSAKVVALQIGLEFPVMLLLGLTAAAIRHKQA